MKRVSVLLLVLLLSINKNYSQNPIFVSYKSMDNIDLLALIKVLDISHLNIKISGDIKGKKGILTRHTVNNGQTNSEDFQIYKPIDSDTIDLIVMATKKADNKGQFYIAIENTYYSRFDLNIENSNHILMETILDSYQDKDTPIFAYTTGISKKIEFNGHSANSIDYCGLRDSKIHPKLWHEKFNISQFVYYTINFVEQ